MILVDANLLLYAYDASSDQHEAARKWWESALSGYSPVRVAWVTVLAFVRIGTDVRMRSPFTLAEAISIVDEWLAEPNFSILGVGAQHWKILARLLPESQARGPLVMDAHLAALAIEHGATLCSNDRDFSRFPGLKFANPLAKG